VDGELHGQIQLGQEVLEVRLGQIKLARTSYLAASVFSNHLLCFDIHMCLLEHLDTLHCSGIDII
jgi:hypothetical protein